MKINEHLVDKLAREIYASHIIIESKNTSKEEKRKAELETQRLVGLTAHSLELMLAVEARVSSLVNKEKDI